MPELDQPVMVVVLVIARAALRALAAEAVFRANGRAANIAGHCSGTHAGPWLGMPPSPLRCGHPRWMDTPPSTSMAVPVTNDAASDARYNAAWATRRAALQPAGGQPPRLPFTGASHRHRRLAAAHGGAPPARKPRAVAGIRAALNVSQDPGPARGLVASAAERWSPRQPCCR